MKTLYAIPGLGTTKELFKFTKIDNVELIVLDWPILSAGETMQSYAKKFLNQIDETKPFSLLGVSFGGMLCAEISLLCKPEKVILLSSCKCRNEFPWFIKLFKSLPIYYLLSDYLIRKLAINSRHILGFEKQFMPEFRIMINSMQINYFKLAFDCIVKWNNKTCKRDDIIHIHGNADKLLYYRNVKADYTISKGSHAMILNNYNEINRLLTQLL